MMLDQLLLLIYLHTVTVTNSKLTATLCPLDSTHSRSHPPLLSQTTCQTYKTPATVTYIQYLQFQIQVCFLAYHG